MELADYLRVLRRRWWLIALAVVVCAAGAFAATLTQTPRYSSSTQILVGGAPNETDTQELVARQIAAQRAGAYSLLLPAPPAVADVARAAGVIGGNPAVSATADGTSAYINITVTADSAVIAQKIAAQYGLSAAKVAAKLEQRPATADVSITVTVPAGLPRSPVSPNPPRNLLVGAAIGLLLGLGGALAREALDARVRDSAEIERLTGVTLLGSIPKEHGQETLPAITRPRSGRAEAYRHVRTNLEFTSADGMPKSIVVTSPAPGEGKSTTAANLAVVAARSGRSVVLVDADLRKPSVARNFGVQASIGLADVLTGGWRWQEALVPVSGENLHILASGSIPRFPSELVGSSRMAQLIEELEAEFEFVIVDSPPVLPVSDALVIGVNVDGVVMVARMVETRRAALKRAIDAVTKVNATLLGVVGNAVVRQEEKAYGEGYGYAYGYTSPASEEPSAPPVVAPAERRSPRRGRHADPTPQPGPAEHPGHPAHTSHRSQPSSLDAAAGLWPGPQQPHAGPSAPAYPLHPSYDQPYQSLAPGQYPPAGQWSGSPQPFPPGAVPPNGYDDPGFGPAGPALRPAWNQMPWGMPDPAAGPVSPPEALNIDEILRQQRHQQ